MKLNKLYDESFKIINPKDAIIFNILDNNHARLWLSPDGRILINTEPEGHSFWAVQIIEALNIDAKWTDPMETKKILLEREWTRILIYETGKGYTINIQGLNANKDIVHKLVKDLGLDNIDNIHIEQTTDDIPLI